MGSKGIFIAATGQNVGKTTICLGLISGLKKHFPKLGFMKPVGQQHEKVEEGLLVDKDVVLFKEHFHLAADYQDMSPVIFPSGFTRDYLDGTVSERELREKIYSSFESITEANDFTIVEGTGHVGVGSLLNLNNAEVAADLGLDAVIIAEGGVGSSFDQLALNKAMCDLLGVKVRGVILNRVLDSKREMILHYMEKALKRWEIPLIGCIPYNQFLSTPAMKDFETLFHTRLLSGKNFHYIHFEKMRLVATSLETFKELTEPGQLIVTPATREDIILEVISWNAQRDEEPHHGLIMTGRRPPSPDLIEKLQGAAVPSLYASEKSFEAMRMITSFTAKIRKEDISKVNKAIDLVEKHINFSLLI